MQTGCSAQRLSLATVNRHHGAHAHAAALPAFEILPRRSNLSRGLQTSPCVGVMFVLCVFRDWGCGPASLSTKKQGNRTHASKEETVYESMTVNNMAFSKRSPTSPPMVLAPPRPWILVLNMGGDGGRGVPQPSDPRPGRHRLEAQCIGAEIPLQLRTWGTRPVVCFQNTQVDQAQAGHSRSHREDVERRKGRWVPHRFTAQQLLDINSCIDVISILSLEKNPLWFNALPSGP